VVKVSQTKRIKNQIEVKVEQRINSQFLFNI